MPASTPRRSRHAAGALAAAALSLATPRLAAAQPPGYGPLARHYDVAGCFDTRICGVGTVDVWSGATNWLVAWNTTLTFLQPGWIVDFARPEPIPAAYLLDYEAAGATTCPRFGPEPPGTFVTPLTCTHTGTGRAPIGYDMSTFDIDFFQYDEVPRPGLPPAQVNFEINTLVLGPAATTAPEPATVALTAGGLLALGVAARRRARAAASG